MTQQEKNEHYFKMTKGSFVLDGTKSFPEDYFQISSKGHNKLKISSDKDCIIQLASNYVGQAINKPIVLIGKKSTVEQVAYENQDWNFKFYFEPSADKPTIEFELLN